MSLKPKRSAGRPANGLSSSCIPCSPLSGVGGLEFLEAVVGEVGGADGAGVDAEVVGGDVDGGVELLLEFALHEGDAGEAAGEGVVGFGADAFDELAGAAGEGGGGGGADVLGGAALGDAVDEFGFGEDGADGGDLGGVGGVFGELGGVVGVVAHVADGFFEEGAGAGGAFVVHAERFDAAVVVGADGFRGLAADVEDGAHGGVVVVDRAGVAGEFGDREVADGGLVAAVAGRGDVADVLAGEVGLGEGLGEGFFGGFGEVEAGGPREAGEDGGGLVGAGGGGGGGVGGGCWGCWSRGAGWGGWLWLCFGPWRGWGGGLRGSPPGFVGGGVHPMPHT